jgi:hypothetical protein
MYPVACYLRKYIIWDIRTTNNQRETKWTLLCQHLFLFGFGGIATYFDPFLGSSSDVHEYYLVSELRHFSYTPEDDTGKGSKHVAITPKTNKNKC